SDAAADAAAEEPANDEVMPSPVADQATTEVPAATVVAPTPAPSGPSGQWVNVTPANFIPASGCGTPYGSQSVVADPARPSNLYTQSYCTGIWKSVDYGQTWSGPINTQPGGVNLNGALSIAAGPAGGAPILYEGGINGPGLGFWRSVDGGVTWTNYNIG